MRQPKCSLLATLGFDDFHHFGSDEAFDMFFKGRQGVRFEVSQRLAEATVR